jgi:hypothetical protein
VELSVADDLLIHQLAEPFSSVSENAESWFDRFYFNLYPDGPGPTVVIGGSRYPNVDMMDGYVCVVVGGAQRNVRFAEPIGRASHVQSIGPLAWDVRVPLAEWSLAFSAPEAGISLDVVWTALTTPHAVDPIQVQHGDGHPTRFAHFFQPGSFRGDLTVDGHRYDVGGWHGMRDRSWGVRRTRERLGLHLWGGAIMADHTVAVLYNEDRAGTPAHIEGVRMWHDGRAPETVSRVEHDLEFDDSDEFQRGLVRVTLDSGEVLDVGWEGIERGLYMAGAGYDGWHGRPREKSHLEIETWPLDGSVSPRNLSLGLVNKLCRCLIGSASSYGVFEVAASRSATYTYRPTLQ